MLTQDSNCSSVGLEGNGDSWQYTGGIVVSMSAGALVGYLNVRRRGAWLRLEEYWHYSTNSPHHEIYVDGCNDPSSDQDSEGASDEVEEEEEELGLNSTD